MPCLFLIIELLVSAVALCLAGRAVAASVAFVWTRRKHDKHVEPLQYGRFVKNRLFDRQRKLVLLQLPLAFVVVTTGLIMSLPYYRTNELRRNLCGSDRLRIRTGGHCHRGLFPEKILFETSEPAVIADFLAQIAFKPTFPGARCRCCGDLSFEFYDEAQLVRTFSLHHGLSIRIKDDCASDFFLSSVSQQALAAWLDRNGVSKQLAEIIERRRQERESPTTQAPSQNDIGVTNRPDSN